MAHKANLSHTPKEVETIYHLNDFPLVYVGEFTYITEILVLTYSSPPPTIKIGKYCSIAEDVKFLMVTDHPYDFSTTYPMYHYFTSLPDQIDLIKKNGTKVKFDNSDIEIQIGSDVWIGHGASILPGVKIGHGAVIGAFAVVAKDVPPYAIVVGNPAKIIKYRFNEEQIKNFLKIKWWDWEHNKIIKSIDKITSVNVDYFLKENSEN